MNQDKCIKVCINKVKLMLYGQSAVFSIVIQYSETYLSPENSFSKSIFDNLNALIFETSFKYQPWTLELLARSW